MNVYKRRRCVTPLILYFSTRWRWVVSITSWAHWKGTLVLLNRWLGRPHSQSRHSGEEKNILPPLWFKPPEHPALNLVTIPNYAILVLYKRVCFNEYRKCIMHYLIEGCEGASMTCHIIRKLSGETTSSSRDLFFFKLNLHPVFSHNFSISLTNTSP
jgi:hypothetical protein